MLRNLDPERILTTSEKLTDRISERFPGSGLNRVSEEVSNLLREATRFIKWLEKPNWWIRGGVTLCILFMLVAVISAVTHLEIGAENFSLGDFVQIVESSVNDVIFLGIAIFFLLTWETRLKRRRALIKIHELRSLAHIIDMHQLTKDPEKLLRDSIDTASSPVRSMTPLELTRYLDYCSELLALLSKIGALYIQRFDDGITLTAVDEIENLTSGLSRKIWQKIMILDRILSSEEKEN